MEVMEEGNLMDRVHILIKRDFEYYTNKQSILQETICPGVVGGKLDFPRSASFAATKLVLWWEEEYIAAYRKSSGFLNKPGEWPDENLTGGCSGIVKSSDPSKFIHLISTSAEQLLDHLHILTQEALDHADLTVLTGTIGAASLLKNCLWFHIQSTETNRSQANELQITQKKYQEMTEALAERLLDLHCRLLSLYILQDADCLDWENPKPFCESERGSYIIQMWWLYMQGTKENLWSNVPPKMAQRVFSGMLNESLTILTVRYSQSNPSEARSKLLITDIANLLLCVAQLLPSICDGANDFLGFFLCDQGKIIRDIHTKCQELFACLILRGAPLEALHKVTRKGTENIELFKPRNIGALPWIIFSLPHIFKAYPKNVLKLSDLDQNILIALELMVLLSQPQPNWAMLLKTLCMSNYKILQMILECSLNQGNLEMEIPSAKDESCQVFLCYKDGSCKSISSSCPAINTFYYYDFVFACTDILLSIGSEDDFKDILLPKITQTEDWTKYFDRRNVWNQKRPPWFEALVLLVKPILPFTVRTVIDAIKTGASMYQSMSIILACISSLFETINPVVSKISFLIQDILPVNCTPLGQSVLIQIIISALYTELLHSYENKKEVRFQTDSKEKLSTDGARSSNEIDSSDESIALAIAESLCSLDEDNKHTDELEEFVSQTKDIINSFDNLEGSSRVEKNTKMLEVLVSDILMTSHGKRSLKVLYNFMKNNSEWLLQQLKVSEMKEEFFPNKVTNTSNPLLHTMFHIGYHPFDQILTGEWKPSWIQMLQIPMGLPAEKVWSQMNMRWEFKDTTSSKLSTYEQSIIHSLTALLKQAQ